MNKIQTSGRTLEKELFINATPQRVFQALTEKAELERWFLVKAEVDLSPGGAISFYWGTGVFNFGKILVLEPPHCLSYTWEAEALEPSPTTITYELRAENDGTRLHLIHAGIGEGEEWDRYYNLRGNGWNIHLEHLAEWLETGTCPSPGPIKRPS